MDASYYPHPPPQELTLPTSEFTQIPERDLTPTPIPRIALTKEERTQLLGHVRLLRLVVNQIIQSKFYEGGHFREIMEASDDEVANYVNRYAALTHRGVFWKVGLTSDQNSTMEADIDITYGRLGKPDGVRQFSLISNFANRNIPELAQYMEEESDEFIADPHKMVSAAETVLDLPRQTRWYPMHVQPDLNSRLVGIMGKAGNPDRIESTSIQVRFSTDGDVDLFAIRPPLFQ